MSTLRVNNITDTSGGSSSLSVPGAAKAWVNFNGTGTVAIRAQLNVSSITDNGTGDYTVNFTTALADANYSCVANREMQLSTGNNFMIGIRTNAGSLAGSVRILSYLTASGVVDPEIVSVSIFR